MRFALFLIQFFETCFFVKTSLLRLSNACIFHIPQY